MDVSRTMNFSQSQPSIFNEFLTFQSLIVNRLQSWRVELDSEHLAAKYFYSELEPETL
jgi:hypothetical protein